ncbi:MAG TPA: hypothetical protein VI999_03820 [Thermoplasmata archaeon]|nr:hypothetical protein [Thermoplasmata archaeon]
MDTATRKATLILGGFVAVFGSLFAFFLVGWIGFIHIVSADPTPVWVWALLSVACMTFFLALIFLLAMGWVRLPVSKAPPSA